MKALKNKMLISALLSTLLLVTMLPIPALAASISAVGNEVTFESQPVGASQPDWKEIIITNNGTEVISLFDGRFTGGGSYVENNASRSEWFEIDIADAAVEWMDENGMGNVYLNPGESIAYWKIRPLPSILGTSGLYSTNVETQYFDQWGHPPMQVAVATINFRVGDENPQDTVNNNSSESSSKNDQSSNKNSEPKAVIETPTNIVSLGDGSSVTSTIHGVYMAKVVDGTAITTLQTDVKHALGIADESTNVSAYFCDSTKKEVNEALKALADAQSKTVAAYFHADMYSITTQGTIASIKDAKEPITMVFGTPKHLQEKTVSILCRDANGNAVVFEDMDSDPNTITISANVFGIYALVY